MAADGQQPADGGKADQRELLSVCVAYLTFSLIMLFASVKWTGRTINLITLFMGPYFVDVLLNQYLMSPQFGFYAIDDRVLLMLLVAQTAFFIGSFAFLTPRKKQFQPIPSEDKFDKYNMNVMTHILLAIGIIEFVRLMLAYRSGAFSSQQFIDSEGLMGSGPLGHLLLASYSIMPIVALHGVNHHDMEAIIATVLIVVVTFGTFIKNNVIGLIISIALFFVFTDRKHIKKSILFAVIIALLVFYANYYIGFSTRGVMVSPNFYLRHFWTYMSGSLIYDNYIFTIGIRPGVSILYKLSTFIFALPNMFLSFFFGFRVFPHERQADLPIAYNGQTSNVVDAIGYIFPSPANIPDIIIFIVFFIAIGVLFGLIAHGLYNKNCTEFNTTLPNFLTRFVVLSFFGTFYINSGPWEILIYCALLPNLFKKKMNLSSAGDTNATEKDAKNRSRLT